MSIFTIIYFMLVAAAIITGIVYFCISHPETAKLIGMCTAVVVITIAMIFFSMPARAEKSEFYPRAAIITELDLDEDLVTCVDSAGCIWQFYGVEDFGVGDIVAMILWDAGTPESIFDDEVIDAAYAGTLNQLGAWIK